MANADSFLPTPINLDLEVPLDLTSTGRIRRTRAEIAAEASRKREAKAIKAAARLAEREQRKAEKAERRTRADARRKAALAKRIAADQRRRDRRDPSRQSIGLKPETPRHVFTERLQDDPEKAFCNHIVDSAWDCEDTFVDFLDARRQGEDTEMKAECEIDLRDRIALGVATVADKIALLALELEEMVEDVVDWLLALGVTDDEEAPDTFEDTSETETPIPVKPRWGSEKVGGGYCVSDIHSYGKWEIEARRGNGWKVHRKYQNRPVSV